MNFFRCALLIGLLLTLAPPALQSQQDESSSQLSEYELRQGWFSRDKAYHFSISAGATAGMYAIGRRIGLSGWQSALASAVIVGTAGVLRETVSNDPQNRITRSFFSRKDLVWDGIGIAVGVPVGVLLSR